MHEDLLTPDLRHAEQEVDSSFRNNALTHFTFAEAVWYILALGEDLQIRDSIRGDALDGHNLRASIDNFVNEAKWPLRWLLSACSEGGDAPTIFNDDLYGEAHALYKLSSEYESFESAFSYGSWGLANLAVEGKRIKTTGAMRQEERYDAYDRLTEHLNRPSKGKPNLEFFLRFRQSVRVSPDRFWYPMSRAVLVEAIENFSSIIDPMFQLPTECKLNLFTIGEFRAVASALSALCLLHLTARVKAAQNGCNAYGILHSILMPHRSDLIRRLHFATGVKGNIVASIIDMLTFGSHDQRNPDIALQPIIQIGSGKIMISPSLVCSLSLERNLLVLINRIPDEQKAYISISTIREELSRTNIETKLHALPLRTWKGNVPNWGKAAEVDLILISDVHKIAMILELKSFISPAEPREIKERSQELKRGLDQLRSRQRMSVDRRPELNQALGITSEYALEWVLCSDNSIGASYVQAEGLPIIMTEHLIAKLLRSDLPTCCGWLRSRSYLPERGKDFEAVETTSTIEGWEIEWYSIRCYTNNFGSTD